MFDQIRSLNFLIRQHRLPFARWIELHLFVTQLNHILLHCQDCVSGRKYVLLASLNIAIQTWHLQLREGDFAELEHVRIYVMAKIH